MENRHIRRVKIYICIDLNNVLITRLTYAILTKNSVPPCYSNLHITQLVYQGMPPYLPLTQCVT